MDLEEAVSQEDIATELGEVEQVEDSATQEPVEVPAPPKLSSSILRRMQRLGVDSERFANLPPEQVEEVLYEIEDRERQILQKQTERQERPAPAPEPKSESDDIDWGEADDGVGGKIKLTAADVGPAASIIQKLHKELREEKKSRKSEREIETSRRHSEVNNTLDSFFMSLGAKGEKLYGKGGAADLADKSEEMNLRRSLIGAAGIDLRADAASVVLQKLAKAHQRFYGKVFVPDEEGAEPQGMTKEKFAKTSLLKPTNRKNGKLPPGPEAARAAADEVFARIEKRAQQEQTEE